MKFVNILKRIFAASSQRIETMKMSWNPFHLIPVFGTAVLSALLFYIFVDDITRLLDGGFRVGDVRIDILMFLYDIEMISDDPITLQRNIGS